MADWCKQCSDEMFGPENPDYVTYEKPPGPGEAYFCLCEGCGPTMVNEKGECIAPDCLIHGEDAKPRDEFPPELLAQGYTEETIQP
jgi:hypothetical protein